jgi:nitrogen fixation NifU-like protein
VSSGLDDLYQDVVMDHGGSPRNLHRVDGAQRSAHGFNPFCGDLIDVEVRLDGGDIADVGFTGKGCAISRASASLMTEAVMERSTDEARTMFEAFRQMITGGENGAAISEDESDVLGDLEALSGVAEYPTRIKCAMLGWRTLIAALDEKVATEMVSTE